MILVGKTMLSMQQMQTSELMDIFRELEVLLDDSNLDECWLDWLRECGDKLVHAPVGQERLDLLRKIRDSERALSQLRAYLQDGGADGAYPRRRLAELIGALDFALQHEIQAQTEPG